MDETKLCGIAPLAETLAGTPEVDFNGSAAELQSGTRTLAAYSNALVIRNWANVTAVAAK